MVIAVGVVNEVVGISVSVATKVFKIVVETASAGEIWVVASSKT
jgi:hypothetical protein